MHDYYSWEGDDKTKDNNELHGVLDSDTERPPCRQPLRMGSKPSTTVADSVSDGHEEAVEPVERKRRHSTVPSKLPTKMKLMMDLTS
jgi:hypothetical protein